ncbi:phage tail assembly protein [Azospirillum cavernae]|uniref:Phage tail assembly protein n=1 Tax=Azospirillum cavernae TaxID=2320860 RepID=A0A418VPL6_9PROT|nr:phage tail assembly protein [Azospirillum cavernae]RJF78194.1 phage tail assembly protein [Azospirillum cavernae]
MLQTEFPFTLPKGYVDSEGTLHREGTMRLATAADELLPAKDPRVRQNEAYLTVILLARVVVRLGTLDMITPKVIEGLFSADFAFLQSLYRKINDSGEDHIAVVCPQCQHSFEIEGGPSSGEG